jgi:hypothetical protein
MKHGTTFEVFKVQRSTFNETVRLGRFGLSYSFESTGMKTLHSWSREKATSDVSVGCLSRFVATKCDGQRDYNGQEF